MSEPNIQERIINQATGQLTLEGFKMLADMNSRLIDVENKLAAAAAILAPTGGATVDDESRTAIAAIIAEFG
jgi:hypothetical protein